MPGVGWWVVWHAPSTPSGRRRQRPGTVWKPAAPPQLGFELAATKRTATLHLYERLGFIGHAITFRRTE